MTKSFKGYNSKVAHEKCSFRMRSNFEKMKDLRRVTKNINRSRSAHERKVLRPEKKKRRREL